MSGRKKFQNFVQSSFFQNSILIVVLLNAILLGVQCELSWNENVEIWISRGLDFCLVFFIVEIILKLAASPKEYFKSRWNCLDFAIVLVSVLAEMSGLLSVRVLRLIRSALTLKIFTGSNVLQSDIASIIESVPRILGMMALMLIFFYIFSVVGVCFFDEVFPENFGNLGSAMLSLFQVTILDSWYDINLPIIKRYPAAVFYFIPFILLSSFILLNIVVGIIVDATSSAAKFRSEDKWLRKNFYGKKSELKEHIDKFQNYLKSFYDECERSLERISKEILANSFKPFGKTKDDIIVKKGKWRNINWIYFALPGCDESDFRIHPEWPFSIEEFAMKTDLFLLLHFEEAKAVDFEKSNRIAFQEVADENKMERIEDVRITYRINVNFLDKNFMDMTESERRNFLKECYQRMNPLVQKVYEAWTRTENKGGL